MASKIFVNYSGNALGAEQIKSIQKRISDALCVCPEDIIVLGDVASINIVEVPDSMTKAREKADAKEAKEAKETAEPKETHKATTHEAHKVK